MLKNFFVRTTLPRRILSLMSIYLWIITWFFFLYELFLYELLSRRTFVITNILHTYFIPYEHLYTNLAYELLLTYFLSDELYPWRTFARTFAYELFPYELLSLRIFSIRTLYHTNFSVRTLSLTNNCVRTLYIRTISIRTLVLQPINRARRSLRKGRWCRLVMADSGQLTPTPENEQMFVEKKAEFSGVCAWPTCPLSPS